jgi:hypothetical protein
MVAAMAELTQRRRRIGLFVVIASIVGSVVAWLLLGGPAGFRRGSSKP